MSTSKDFSTISYNSVEFLTAKLEQFRKAHIISKWYFIQHKAESDEKKDHIHVFITPARRINTSEFLDEFQEIDPLHPDKPFKCLTGRPSQFRDWYLYSIHDPIYLASKGLTREHFYTEEDIIASDDDEKFRDIRSITNLDNTPIQLVLNAVLQGEDFTDFVMRGTVPIQQLVNYEKAWNLCCSFAQRNNLKTINF